MSYPRRFYGYHGIFSNLTGVDRKFIRVIYGALAAVVVLALLVDAVFSPMTPPVPKPTPVSTTYYKDLSWQAVLTYYGLGALFYGLVMLMAMLQEGTIQRLWFKWRWSLWQRHSRASFMGEAPKGLLARWVLKMYDKEKVSLDTFYQWLAEANEAFEEGRLEEAREAYARAVALRPVSIVARVNLGAALGRLGRHAEALEQFREVLALDSANGDALKNAALALLQIGRAGEARSLLAPHLEAHPRDAEAWWIEARCRAEEPGADPQEIAESLERACRMEPSRRRALQAEPAFAPFLGHPALRALTA